ncbi:2-C-methyl-D-erythritol 4-phosphate cytidylyltransferase [Salmonella enterica subsp. enterica]|nr:2-C-methyl-D-erythritol 4-phosphate cytidylyltransferase [Salmonella enterica subsp. enterica]
MAGLSRCRLLWVGTVHDAARNLLHQDGTRFADHRRKQPGRRYPRRESTVRDTMKRGEPGRALLPIRRRDLALAQFSPRTLARCLTRRAALNEGATITDEASRWNIVVFMRRYC